MDPMMLQQLLAQLQGGGAQGFMMPGGGMPIASGAPQMPGAGTRGASAGMPPMPSAFGPTGQMQGQGGQQGGIFSQIAGNPAIMKMLMGGAASASGAPQMPGSNFNPDDIFRMKQMFSNGGNPMSQEPMGGQTGGGIMELIRSMFGGGGGR